MRISKIYSNDSRMNPMIFNPGFNVIYGDVEDKKGEKNEHNLGKTSLVHLISFLFLKGLTKKDFLSKFKNKFTNWVFYIEIELPKGDFLTIKRGVDNPTLISFKTHDLSNQNFTTEIEWNHKDIKLNAKKSKDAVSIFEEYLNFDVLTNYSERHFLSYLLRTQKDYDDVFKMSQFQGLDIDWKPQLFALLGYNAISVEEKLRMQNEIKGFKTILTTMLGKNRDTIGDSYTLKATISEKEDEKNKVLEQINKFNFYLKEKKVNKELVENIESQISNLNSKRYRLDHEIKQIRKSLETQVTFDLDEIAEIFEDAHITFPQELKKSYQDLLDFNTSLSTERSRYLKQDLQANLSQLENVVAELIRLNTEKENMLAVLRDSDTFSKYKVFQNNVFELEGQINQLKVKLSSLGTAENYQNKIDTLKTSSKEAAVKIKESIDLGNDTFTEINNLFKEIFKTTLEYTALLLVKPNKEGNPDFVTHTIDLNDNDQLTGKGDGYTATKVQCAAFVIAVLVAYRKHQFYRFAYHDGLLESWGDIPKTNFLKEIRTLTKEKDFQYIISMIKSDIPKNFSFEKEEIVTSLSHENPLFGFSF